MLPFVKRGTCLLRGTGNHNASVLHDSMASHAFVHGYFNIRSNSSNLSQIFKNYFK